MHLSTGIVSSLLASTACAVAVKSNEHLRRQSNNTGYELKTPPLDTPWTSTVGTNPWPEYPRPQLARSDWKNLNGVWQYQNASGFDELDSPPFGKDLDQVALVPFCLESGLSGVQGEFLFYSWYRTTFDVPSNWSSDNHVLLNFGAVDYNATVFVNGEQVYNNIGGYFAFTVDVTDHLSNKGDNELVVFVFDPTDLYPYNIPLGKQRLLNTDHIFYRPCSGIWQTVWLESAPTENIAHLDLAADMNGQVNVTVHSSKGDSSSQYEIIIYESGSTDVKANATGTVNSPFIFKVDSPKLWSPDSPTLYNITIKLGSDTVQSYTGFRSVSSGLVDGFHRPLLNGNFTFLFGTLDQGFWPDGLYSPPSVEAMVFDLKALKEVGYNMLRKHIKVEPALFYQACDQLGIMLIQDMPALTTFQYNVPQACPDQEVSVAIASNTQQAFNDQLATLIKQLRSYPSIMTWVIYNEGWGQPGYPGITDFELTDLVRSLDPTRLIDSVTGWNDHGAGDYHDNHHYSSPQCGTPFYSTASTPYDGKRIAIQGEFGGIGHNISDEHAWKVQTSIDMVNRTYELDADLTIWNYRAHHIFEELNDQITRFGACSGAVWTQTTDVEGEVNGMLTYDRRLNRMDKEQWKKDIQGLYDAAKNAGKTAGNATMRMMARDELGVGL